MNKISNNISHVHMMKLIFILLQILKMEQYFLIPVIIGFISVFVYIFGFKKLEEPKFKKSVSDKESSKLTQKPKRKEKNQNNIESKSKVDKTQTPLKKKDKESKKQKVTEKRVEEEIINKISKKHESKVKVKSNSKTPRNNENEKLRTSTNNVSYTPEGNNDGGWFEVTSKKNKKNDDINQINKVFSSVKQNNKLEKNDKNNKQIKNKELQKKIIAESLLNNTKEKKSNQHFGAPSNKNVGKLSEKN